MRVFFQLTVMCLVGLLPGGVSAQQATECDWRANAWSIPEPWMDNTREFSNGVVRLTKTDTGEPVWGAQYLLILSPPYGVLGDRQCRVIGWPEREGFEAIHFSEMTSEYDPALGLLFRIPVEIHLPDNEVSTPALLSVRLNQATGEIEADLVVEPE